MLRLAYLHRIVTLVSHPWIVACYPENYAPNIDAQDRKCLHITHYSGSIGEERESSAYIHTFKGTVLSSHPEIKALRYNNIGSSSGNKGILHNSSSPCFLTVLCHYSGGFVWDCELHIMDITSDPAVIYTGEGI